MSLKLQIDQDLKQALLGGNRIAADTLKMVKSTILNEEIAQGIRDTGLTDEAILQVLKKESKKRQEAFDMYTKAGASERADKEAAEKKIIEAYLPDAMPETEIIALIDQAVLKYGDVVQSNMGQIIGEVKKSSGGAADGSEVARLVKIRLSK